MNKSQQYLLDNNLDDLVLNPKEKDSTKWVYVSDIMMSFKNECPHCKAGRVSFDTYDKELKCWVTNSKECEQCKGKGAIMENKIIDNKVHLCNACKHDFADCEAKNDDIWMGDGKGNDNVVCCNKFEPVAMITEEIKKV